jgi:hypothetical protein
MQMMIISQVYVRTHGNMLSLKCLEYICWFVTLLLFPFLFLGIPANALKEASKGHSSLYICTANTKKFANKIEFKMDKTPPAILFAVFGVMAVGLSGIIISLDVCVAQTNTIQSIKQNLTEIQVGTIPL